MLPTPFLDSLAGLPGFDKNAFAQVHAQGEQITSVRLNKYKPFNQAAHPFLKTAAPMSWCDKGLYLNERPLFVLDPLWHAGAYYVQEASSMFIQHLLHHLNMDTKSLVLDLCAAPGGKSTLLDVIMGLLVPTKGHLKIDDNIIDIHNYRSWQVIIAHVPQAIYLSDTSLAENIAFGVEPDKIDMTKLREAAQKAQIAETIEALPQKYDTFVGERGIRLSGGQRQRIGIARALYKNAQVIVFDEATSALDNETELAVMEGIEQLADDLTILIVAHRVSTLKRCDKIFRMDKGEIIEEGVYEEMVG